MYALLYIFYDSLSSATVRTPNPAFEHGRADKQRAFGKRQCRRAAQRNRYTRSGVDRAHGLNYSALDGGSHGRIR